MMTRIPMLRTAVFVTLIAAPLTAHAQGVNPPEDPSSIEGGPGGPGGPPDESGLQIGIGVVSIYSPAFLGSKDYQLMAAPNLEIRYNRFFASVLEGVGFDLIKTDKLRAGPIFNFEQSRKENGKNPLALIGDDTKALQGLGTVKSTAEFGGFVEYEFGSITTKAQVRKGINGHKGMIAELSADYMGMVPGVSFGGRPVMFGIGPKLVAVDKNYNDTYFGIDAVQSANSGLRQFKAKGGLQSYGLSGMLLHPLSDKLGAAMFTSYDRLTGDAAKSPLVTERGSKNQFSVGLGLTYKFGL